MEVSMSFASPIRRLPSVLLVLALAAGLTSGCGGDPAAPGAEPFTKVLVIGADGLEWSVLQPLMEQGHCPNLRALMERGAFGKLATFIPTWSPVVWTSIATSKTKEQHGIEGFTDQQKREYTSSRREGRAIWNIVDLYGLTTNVFGWWITWPVEPVRGVMVSATSASSMEDQNWKPALIPGLGQQVHPPELTERVMAVAAEAADMGVMQRLQSERIFKQVPLAGWPAREKKLIDQTGWSILSDETYRRLALDIIPDHPADLNMVYFGGTDVAGHRFWRQYEPDAFEWTGTSPEADQALACVIPNYYVWFDEMVGQLVETVGEDTTVFVVSDHGMHASGTQSDSTGGITGNHQDGAAGVIIAAGPGIQQLGSVDRFVRSGAVAGGPTVMAITPTILGLLGIPYARDMQDRPFMPYLTPEARAHIEALVPVDSHDDGFRDSEMVTVPDEKEGDFIERMGQLGYVMGQYTGGSQLVRPEDVEATSGLPRADMCNHGR